MGPAALEALLVAIQCEDASARSSAGRALVTLGEPAIAPLVEIRRTNRDPGVRREASRALEALGWKPDSGPAREAEMEAGR